MCKINYDYEYVIELINSKSDLDRTNEKERWGDLAIKDRHLWDVLFPNNVGWKKITDKRTQKLGVDYKIFTSDGEINVDIKVCIGNDYTEGLPVEVYQRPIRESDVPSSYTFTNRSSKLTDFMVYIVLDRSGFRVYNVPYQEIRRVSKQYMWHFEEVMTNKGLCYKCIKSPELCKSFNKTGYYVKYDFETFRVNL